METDKKCIFNNDIHYMKGLVGKAVEVRTTENVSHNGIVYVIDPESKTLVLVTQKEPKFNDVVGEMLLKDDFEQLEDCEELLRRRTNLKIWLQDNLVSVQEEGLVLKLDNQLRIEPPYDVEQCFCNNTVVLDRIRTIIKRMPLTCNQ